MVIHTYALAAANNVQIEPGLVVCVVPKRLPDRCLVNHTLVS